jgi:AcrR family transcriptional regulator
MSTNEGAVGNLPQSLGPGGTVAAETTSVPGLRQRKKDETRARVREAAISVTLRDGCQKATVDVITREADVAARTFFNYFESKERALVGIEEGHIRAAAEQALSVTPANSEASIASRVVTFLVDILVRAVEAAPNAEGRREVLKQNPELFEWQIRELDQIGATLRPVVAAIVAALSVKPVTEDVADQIFMTCLGAVAATGRARLHTHRATELVSEAVDRVHDASELLSRPPNATR